MGHTAGAGHPAKGQAIVVDGLAKRYGSRAAVQGLSFGVGAGELFAFLGPNGAGKTTTIGMLCTLLRPTAGTATVNGYDVIRAPAAVRHSIGLVFQQQAVDDYLTGEQNLRLAAHAYGIPRRERDHRLRDLLVLVDLWDRRGDLVHTYSGGMKRKLEVVRGLLHQPRVLFLDEPTLGVDAQTRRLLWARIAELRAREGLTIFLTTHYMEEAEACDRVAIIDRGALVALDTPAHLKAALGGDVVSLEVGDAAAAAMEVQDRYQLVPRVEGHGVAFTVPDGPAFLPAFVRSFPQPLASITVRQPTLEDVFLTHTGHAL